MGETIQDEKNSASESGSTKKDRSIWVTIGSTAGLKIIVMGVSGLLGVINTKLIIANFGVPAYGQYGLLASLPSLLPFASLGMAAVVINAVAEAEDPRNDQEMARTLTTALRYLTISSLAIIFVGAVISIIQGWPTLLGDGLLPGGDLITFICVLVFAITLPLTIFPRLIIALGRPQAQVLSQVVVAPVNLLCVLALIWFAVPGGNSLAVWSYVANSLAAVVCAGLAWRALGPNFNRMIKDIPRFKTVPNAAIMGVAWPQLAQLLALPIAMQTDRLLLSHLTQGTELAQYNMVSQFFQMLVQTITAGGVALWPMYAKARANKQIMAPWRITWIFTGLGLLGAAMLAGVSPLLALFLFDGQVTLSWWLILGFVAYVGTQAANYPLGMYMTDEKGLKFQVLPIVIMVPINLGISWWMTLQIGAGGPIIGSSISVVLCQILPNIWYISRDITKRREELETSFEPESD